MNGNEIPTCSEYDGVVVGGGAAGLSAALVLFRARRSVAVVDAGHPRNAPAAHMQGFLSRDGMPPAHAVSERVTHSHEKEIPCPRFPAVQAPSRPDDLGRGGPDPDRAQPAAG